MAAIALLALLPLLILVAIVVFVADQQSPFFVQERVGKKKVLFRIIKFRTMRNNKVTPLGRLLRKTGIDELPQLLNIISGKMSFVGPRPLTKEDVQRLCWDDDYYSQRWSMKPGIVGLAQLSPVCHKKMSWYLDRYYIQEQNFFLDLKIITWSILIPVVGKDKMKKWLHNKWKYSLTASEILGQH